LKTQWREEEEMWCRIVKRKLRVETPQHVSDTTTHPSLDSFASSFTHHQLHFPLSFSFYSPFLMSQKNTPTSSNTSLAKKRQPNKTNVSENKLPDAKTKTRSRHASATNPSHSKSGNDSPIHHKNNSTPVRETKNKLQKEKQQQQHQEKPQLPLQKPSNVQEQSKPKVPITIPNTPRTVSQIVQIQKYFRYALARRELEKRRTFSFFNKLVNF
jgi:hypothetical protein